MKYVALSSRRRKEVTRQEATGVRRALWRLLRVMAIADNKPLEKPNRLMKEMRRGGRPGAAATRQQLRVMAISMAGQR